MAILNLVVRTLSCMVLYKQWTDRSAGLVGFNSNSSRQPKNYQDLEGQQSYPGIDPLAPPYH